MNIFKKLKKYIAINFTVEKDPTKRIISFWEKDGADFEYYKSAEQEDWMKIFWDTETVFYQLFQNLNLEHTLEIACGAGRHSSKIIDKIKTLFLLDSSEEALVLAKQRFSAFTNITYIHNKSGFGIPQHIVNDNSLTAVFSYDAMVHFEKESIESYLIDTMRVLQPNGYALFHHSNYDKNPGGKFTDNPGWRNYMTKDLFLSMAQKHGFEVVHSEVITFAAPDSDCITLLKKAD